MGMDEDWVARWEKKLQNVAPNYGHFQPGRGKIFRVSEHFRESDPKAYEPKIISIGPYHRDKLQEMNQDKLLYLKNILQRNTRITLQNIMERVYGLVPGSRSCYSGDINMDDREFAEMLLLDGCLCFIIELMLAHREKKQQQEVGGNLLADPQPGGDSILDDSLTLSLLQFDIFLLENQLPYIVLKSLFNLVGAPDGEYRMPDLENLTPDVENPLPDLENSTPEVESPISGIENSKPRVENPLPHVANPTLDQEIPNSFIGIFTEFFKDLIKDLPPITPLPPPETDFYHLLHLFHACFIGKDSDERPTPSMLMTPSASDLMKVSVKFKQNTDRGFSWDISYKKSVIEVSPARLNSSSNSFYRNLVTFEQYYFCGVGVRSRVMAYVMLMSCLINSEDDLALLRQEGIIAYTLKYQEATRFFRKLCKESIIDYDNSYLSQLHDRSMDAWKLQNSKWNRYKAKVKQNLFSDPIYIAYLIAGFVLAVVLTIVQTVYALLKYYHHPKQS